MSILSGSAQSTDPGRAYKRTRKLRTNTHQQRRTHDIAYIFSGACDYSCRQKVRDTGCARRIDSRALCWAATGCRPPVSPPRRDKTHLTITTPHQTTLRARALTRVRDAYMSVMLKYYGERARARVICMYVRGDIYPHPMLKRVIGLHGKLRIAFRVSCLWAWLCVCVFACACAHLLRLSSPRRHKHTLTHRTNIGIVSTYASERVHLRKRSGKNGHMRHAFRPTFLASSPPAAPFCGERYAPGSPAWSERCARAWRVL